MARERSVRTSNGSSSTSSRTSLPLVTLISDWPSSGSRSRSAYGIGRVSKKPLRYVPGTACGSPSSRLPRSPMCPFDRAKIDSVCARRSRARNGSDTVHGPTGNVSGSIMPRPTEYLCRTSALEIFDVDGVLVDSPHARAWRESLRELMEGDWSDTRARTTWSPDAFTPQVYQTQVSGKPRTSGARAGPRLLPRP